MIDVPGLEVMAVYIKEAGLESQGEQVSKWLYSMVSALVPVSRFLS